MIQQNNQLHIAWTAFQRRQVSMESHVGFQCVFMPMTTKGGVTKALTYIKHFFSTLRIFLQRKPDTVWVQLPQVPLLWAALLFRAVFNRDVRVVADCHNAMFRPPWSKFPFAMWSLKQADVILVHNQEMLNQALKHGLPEDKVCVLEDVPPVGREGTSSSLARSLISAVEPWIVFPGSFAADEPIQEVMEAARLLPDYTFIVTGRLANATKYGHSLEGSPPNFITPGFLDLDVFDDLLREANVVMGLTKVEGIQLSVCNEALGFGKPLVTSNTDILRQMFGKAAVLVETSDPQSIADGCRKAYLDRIELAEMARDLAVHRLSDWKHGQLTRVLEFLKL